MGTAQLQCPHMLCLSSSPQEIIPPPSQAPPGPLGTLARGAFLPTNIPLGSSLSTSPSHRDSSDACPHLSRPSSTKPPRAFPRHAPNSRRTPRGAWSRPGHPQLSSAAKGTNLGSHHARDRNVLCSRVLLSPLALPGSHSLRFCSCRGAMQAEPCRCGQKAASGYGEPSSPWPSTWASSEVSLYQHL